MGLDGLGEPPRFLVDALRVDLDSVSRNGASLATPYDLNLDNLFFKYGLRLNQNLLLDLNSGQIPLVTGMVICGVTIG